MNSIAAVANAFFDIFFSSHRLFNSAQSEVEKLPFSAMYCKKSLSLLLRELWIFLNPSILVWKSFVTSAADAPRDALLKLFQTVRQRLKPIINQISKGSKNGQLTARSALDIGLHKTVIVRYVFAYVPITRIILNGCISLAAGWLVLVYDALCWPWTSSWAMGNGSSLSSGGRDNGRTLIILFEISFLQGSKRKIIKS